MSLEERIHSLTIAIEKLHDLILENREGVMIFDDIYPDSKRGDTITIMAPDNLDEIAESHEESPMPTEVQSTDSKTMELINLSKRMGYPYLMQDGKLIVDNEVLNTYSRQGHKDEV